MHSYFWVAILLHACASSPKEDEQVFLPNSFANYCQAFEAVGHLSLKYHLNKSGGDFLEFRKRTAEFLAKKWKQENLPPYKGDGDCSDLEDMAPASLEESEIYIQAAQIFVGLLDPHSAYLSPKDMERFLRKRRNREQGIGVEFQKSVTDRWQPPSPFLRVEEVFKGSPAWQILDPGLNVEIKVFPTTISSQKELIYWTEHPDDSVQLQTEYSPEPEILSNSEYDWSPTFARLLEKENQTFGYLKLRQFTEESAAAVQDILEDFEADGSVQAILMDLRDNPGGLVKEAVKLADLFLDTGLVVRTSGNSKKDYPKELDPNATYTAENQGAVSKKLLIVLMDSDTASAGELLAGALWNRALLIGDRTFGKGVGQSQLRLGNEGFGLGGMILLTTFRYEFADQYAPQGRGVTPHILMPHPDLYNLKEERKREQKDTFLREEDYGERAIPSTGTANRRSPQGRIGALIESLRNQLTLPKDCEGLGDCQLERALWVGVQAIQQSDVDRIALAF